MRKEMTTLSDLKLFAKILGEHSKISFSEDQLKQAFKEFLRQTPQGSLPHLKYFGGKFYAIDQIISFFPTFTSQNQIYIEPFAGSFVVGFALNPKNMILNDKNQDLNNFFKHLGDPILSEKVSSRLESIQNYSGVFEELKKSTSELDRACLFYLKSRLGHMGLMSSHYTYKLQCSVLKKDFIEWTRWFNQRISVFWDLDFKDLLEKVFSWDMTGYSFYIYLDPPYVDQGKHYEISFSEKDHQELSESLKKLSQKSNVHWILSYDKCEMIKSLYKDFYQQSISFKRGGDPSQQDYSEILISNKPFRKLRSSNHSLSSFLQK